MECSEEGVIRQDMEMMSSTIDQLRLAIDNLEDRLSFVLILENGQGGQNGGIVGSEPIPKTSLMREKILSFDKNLLLLKDKINNIGERLEV